MMLEHDAMVVGEPLSFFGADFLEPSDGQTKIVFEGTYVWVDEDGFPVVEQITPTTISPLYDGTFPDGASHQGVSLDEGTHVLRWNRFGPFQIPFTQQGNRAGTFKGTVSAVNIFEDGVVVEDPEPMEFTLDVKPSVIITRFEPVLGVDGDGELRSATCGSPALRGIGGLPYVLEVEAVGFEPAYFIYQLSGVNKALQWQEFVHQADASRGGKDRLGDPTWLGDEQSPEMVVLDPVAETNEFAYAGIRITAVDVNDNSYHTALPLQVVRPLAFHYDGNHQLAEYYEPVVVHPPIVGGIGTSVTYSETHSESRQNAVSVNISNSWSKSKALTQSSNWSEGVGLSESVSSTNAVGISHSESESASETYGASYSSSESNNVNVSSTSGSNWGWNATEGVSGEVFQQQMNELYGEASAEFSTTVSGEGSIPGFAKVGGSVGTKVGVKGGAKTGQTEGAKEGWKSDFGTHMYGSESETLAFGSTTTDTVSENVSGTYGLQFQNTINQQVSETQATALSTTYNMGGAVGLSDGVTEGGQESWTESWVSSSTDTNLLSYSSKVPNGRCAVIYRQTVRYVRKAQLYSYDLCGIRSLAGEMHFNEWLWAPNIVIGDDCDSEMPASTQPSAQCFHACD